MIFYGAKEDLTEKIKLHAGQLDLVYENGFLRYIRLGDDEVIRLINHAVRDFNWGTADFKITNQKIIKNANSFHIEYTAQIDQDDIQFVWNCEIKGTEDSTIQFTIEGEALSTFKRNRIGFTVLHPVKECTGRKMKITHPNGKTSESIFPETISPHQPFMDIQSMEWLVSGRTARLDFSGDIFETEDQRNWIDDSYKTYCTPLSRPFPVVVEKGQKIRQDITLSMSGDRNNVKKTLTSPSVSISNTPCKLPKIGIGQSSEVEQLNDHEIERILKVKFDHYQANLILYEIGWPEKWKRIKKESELLQLPLELSLFFEHTSDEIAAFRQTILTYGYPEISMINIFNRNPHSTQKGTLEIVVPVLRKLFPNSKIGGGTNAFFTELNRDRTPSQNLDFLVYSINPQVHSSDNDSLVETLHAIPYTVKSAQAFSNNKPVHISPITFKMRWNPNATGEIKFKPDAFPVNVDKRQLSLFGAGWLVGTINYIINAFPEVLTFFETVGLGGIMQSSKPKFPDYFPAPAGSVYPMFFIFESLLRNKRSRFYHVISSHPDHFSGIAWGKEQPEALILVNFQLQPVSVNLPIQFTKGSVQEINHENIMSLIAEPTLLGHDKYALKSRQMELPPFGIAMIESKELK